MTDEVETHALSDVHMDIKEGEYVAIAGPAGCGKTTLLSILGLLDTASDGKYTLAGQDVTSELRSETAGAGASRVAAWPPLRAALLARQHAFAQPPGLVADGRDMGTVVFPTADLKIFLTASADERALRRYKQLKDKDSGVSLAALSREIAERDLRDSTRAVAPLKPAPDAEVIDSTALTIEQVVNRVLELGRERSLWP
jgi:cytidylate kinase